METLVRESLEFLDKCACDLHENICAESDDDLRNLLFVLFTDLSLSHGEDPSPDGNFRRAQLLYMYRAVLQEVRRRGAFDAFSQEIGKILTNKEHEDEV